MDQALERGYGAHEFLILPFPGPNLATPILSPLSPRLVPSPPPFVHSVGKICSGRCISAHKYQRGDSELPSSPADRCTKVLFSTIAAACMCSTGTETNSNYVIWHSLCPVVLRMHSCLRMKCLKGSGQGPIIQYLLQKSHQPTGSKVCHMSSMRYFPCILIKGYLRIQHAYMLVPMSSI